MTTGWLSMELLLVSGEIATKIESYLQTFANQNGWTLSLTQIIEKRVLSAFTTIVYQIGETTPYPVILDAIRQSIASDSGVQKFLVVDSYYVQERAAQLAFLNNAAYIVDSVDLPLSEKTLISLLNDDFMFEQMLASIQSQFGQIINQSSLISITSAEGDILYANANFSKISGYSQQELLGSNHRILKSGLHEDSFYKIMWETIASGKRWKGRVRNRRKDGSFYWVDSVIQPIFDSRGEPKYYASIRNDVTTEVELFNKLAEKEERFRISHQYANIGSWEWCTKTDNVYWSPEVHKLFGYDRPVLETTRENFLRCVHEEDREKVERAIEDCRTTGDTYYVEHRVIHPDGSIKWVSETGHFSVDENGEKTQMLGIIADIHELKMAQERAITSEHSKSNFISTLSHEIRNPLNAITGYTQLIANQSDPKITGDYATKITRITDYVERILQDINLNSKLENGKVEAKLAPLSIDDILDDCLSMLPKTDIPVSIERLTKANYIEADSVYLKQVILNLLTNAIKYNNNNGHVTVQISDCVNNAIRIAIIDTGKGISPSDLERVFEPYERLKTNEKNVDGLGLGLPICKSLVDLMNGNMGANSAVNQGSTFWIEMPLSAIESRRTAPSAEHRKSWRTDSLKGLKALVVEDNEFNREVLYTQLSQIGIECDTTNDGQHALRALESKDYQLIITDLNMPNMNGAELIKTIRQHQRIAIRDCPIIGISADINEIDTLSNNGANVTLKKPFSSTQATLAIHSALNGEDTETIEPTNQELLVNNDTIATYLGSDKSNWKKYLDKYRLLLEQELPCFENYNLLSKPTVIRFCSHKLLSSSLYFGENGFTEALDRIQLLSDEQSTDNSTELVKLAGYCANSMRNIIKEIEHKLEGLQHHEEQTEDLQSNIYSDSHEPHQRISLLAIDDDAFSLLILQKMLERITTIDFHGETSAEVALSHLRDKQFDLIVCDINMPKIDGIQFVRLLSEIGSTQNIAIYSGEKHLFAPLQEMLKKYGMNYAGSIDKPINELDLIKVINRLKSCPRQLQSNHTVSNDEIAECIENNQLEVHFQPQVCTKSKRIVAAEALARLRNKKGELIPPALFIPKLSELGLESEFALKVARIAVCQCAQWNNQGWSMGVSINFSMNALEDTLLPDQILHHCQDQKINPELIVIEVTESSISRQPELCIEVLSRLKLMGFRISVDDFGTGYSSLEKLKNFPFTELKLDRSYVSSATTNGISKTLMTASVAIAKELDLITVAEGVETAEDFTLACQHRVDLVQGYYFSKPLIADQFAMFYKRFCNANAS